MNVRMFVTGVLVAIVVLVAAGSLGGPNALAGGAIAVVVIVAVVAAMIGTGKIGMGGNGPTAGRPRTRAPDPGSRGSGREPG